MVWSRESYCLLYAPIYWLFLSWPTTHSWSATVSNAVGLYIDPTCEKLQVIQLLCLRACPDEVFIENVAYVVRKEDAPKDQRGQDNNINVLQGRFNHGKVIFRSLKSRLILVLCPCGFCILFAEFHLKEAFVWKGGFLLCWHVRQLGIELTNGFFGNKTRWIMNLWLRLGF